MKRGRKKSGLFSFFCNIGIDIYIGMPYSVSTKREGKPEGRRNEMEKGTLTIDISKLDEKDLEALAEMFYKTGKANECKTCNEQLAFLRGWTDKNPLA